MEEGHLVLRSWLPPLPPRTLSPSHTTPRQSRLMFACQFTLSPQKQPLGLSARPKEPCPPVVQNFLPQRPASLQSGLSSIGRGGSHGGEGSEPSVLCLHWPGSRHLPPAESAPRG